MILLRRSPPITLQSRRTLANSDDDGGTRRGGHMRLKGKPRRPGSLTGPVGSWESALARVEVADGLHPRAFDRGSGAVRSQKLN